MSRASRTLTGLALLTTILGACSQAASGSPDGSLPVVGGRGSNPGAEPSSMAASTRPGPSGWTGRVTLLDQFPTAMESIGATCRPRSGIPEHPMIACALTDPATGTRFEFDGYGRGDRFSSMTSGAVAADGGLLDLSMVAQVFGTGLTAISADAHHAGITWIRDHVASVGDIGEAIDGYHFEVTNMAGTFDVRKAVRVTTSIDDGTDPRGPTPTPAATAASSGPLANIDAFSERFSAVPGVTCSEAVPGSPGQILRCTATDPATNVSYRFSAFGTSDRLDHVFVRVLAPAGRTVDDVQVANVFERTVALVSGDYTHPGMAWVRTHVDDIDSDIVLAGYGFEIYVPEEASSSTQGRGLMISTNRT